MRALTAGEDCVPGPSRAVNSCSPHGPCLLGSHQPVLLTPWPHISSSRGPASLQFELPRPCDRGTSELPQIWLPHHQLPAQSSCLMLSWSEPAPHTALPSQPCEDGPPQSPAERRGVLDSSAGAAHSSAGHPGERHTQPRLLHVCSKRPESAARPSTHVPQGRTLPPGTWQVLPESLPTQGTEARLLAASLKLFFGYVPIGCPSPGPSARVSCSPRGPGFPAASRRRRSSPSAGPKLTLSSGGHRQLSCSGPRLPPNAHEGEAPICELGCASRRQATSAPPGPVRPGGQGARPREGSETRGRRTEAGTNSGLRPQPCCPSHLDHEPAPAPDAPLMTQPALPDRRVVSAP